MHITANLLRKDWKNITGGNSKILVYVTEETEPSMFVFVLCMLNLKLNAYGKSNVK
jgi:hypothetical protein